MKLHEVVLPDMKCISNFFCRDIFPSETEKKLDGGEKDASFLNLSLFAFIECPVSVDTCLWVNAMSNVKTQ